MSMRARWSTPGRRSAPARRSASAATSPAAPASAACSSRCRPGPVIIEDDCFIGARAEVAEGVDRARRARCSRWASISAPRPASSTAPAGKVSYGEVPPYSVVVSGSHARRLRRAVALLRGDREAGRREDARQDLHQRTPARLRPRGEPRRPARRSPVVWLLFGLKGRISRHIYWLVLSLPASA